MSGTKGHSGGARQNAGRKASPARIERLEPILQQIDDRLEQHVEDRLSTLEQLAQGGIQTVTEHWQLASTVVIDTQQELLAADGAPTGKTVRHKLRALPDKPADELVLVSRTLQILPPNLAANIYLVNRLAGPPANLETPDDQPDTNTLSDELEAAITRIYGPDAKD
jgi:hypothetical protein